MGRLDQVERSIERFGGLSCFYCGRPVTIKSLQLDHAMPKYRYNSKDPELVISCTRCNGQKSVRTICEYRVYLGVLWFQGERALGFRLRDDRESGSIGIYQDADRLPLCIACGYCPAWEKYQKTGDDRDLEITRRRLLAGTGYFTSYLTGNKR